jgi:hypothetical protein
MIKAYSRCYKRAGEGGKAPKSLFMVEVVTRWSLLAKSWLTVEALTSGSSSSSLVLLGIVLHRIRPYVLMCARELLNPLERTSHVRGPTSSFYRLSRWSAYGGFLKKEPPGGGKTVRPTMV